MGKAATPPKPPATKKRKRAPVKRKAPPPPLPPPHVPLDLAEKLEKIQEHSNMVVKQVNNASEHMTMMTQHIQFLHKKLIEQHGLYAREFKRLENAIDDLECQLRRQGSEPLSPLFDELDNVPMYVEPMTVEEAVGLRNFDQHLMSEEELVQCMSTGDNE